MRKQASVSVRSELAVVEATFLWVLNLVLGAVIVATTSEPWSIPIAVFLVVLLLWVAVAWSLRRVVVDDNRVTEVRLWPIKRTWPAASVEKLRLAPWDVGAIALPATRVEMDIEGESVWFPTLQAWALTTDSRRRARERVERLADRLGRPWTDTVMSE